MPLREGLAQSLEYFKACVEAEKRSAERGSAGVSFRVRPLTSGRYLLGCASVCSLGYQVNWRGDGWCRFAGRCV